MRRGDTEAEQRDDSERYTAISHRQPCRIVGEPETVYREAGRGERRDGDPYRLFDEMIAG